MTNPTTETLRKSLAYWRSRVEWHKDGNDMIRHEELRRQLIEQAEAEVRKIEAQLKEREH